MECLIVRKHHARQCVVCDFLIAELLVHASCKGHRVLLSGVVEVA